MADTSAIREHMEVIGANGGHIGTIDHLDGQRIKLTRQDRGAGDHHHWLPINLVADVDGDRVRMSFNSELVQQFWEEQ